MTFFAITALILITVVPAALLWIAFSKRQQQSPNQIYLNEKERKLHQQIFCELEPLQFDQLMKVALWREVKAKEILIRQGEPVEDLSLVLRGRLTADLGRNRVAEIGPGQFIGEMSFVSGHPGSVTVSAFEDTTVVQWPQDKLKILLSENKVLSNYFQSLFQRDMIKKLEQ